MASLQQPSPPAKTEQNKRQFVIKIIDPNTNEEVDAVSSNNNNIITPTRSNENSARETLQPIVPSPGQPVVHPLYQHLPQSHVMYNTQGRQNTHYPNHQVFIQQRQLLYNTPNPLYFQPALIPQYSSMQTDRPSPHATTPQVSVNLILPSQMASSQQPPPPAKTEQKKRQFSTKIIDPNTNEEVDTGSSNNNNITPTRSTQSSTRETPQPDAGGSVPLIDSNAAAAEFAAKVAARICNDEPLDHSPGQEILSINDVTEKLLQPISDPAEYLFKTTEFHDCHITVGDPDSEEVETIGVSRVHLVSHSSVFRDMLKDSGLADPSGRNTVITDIPSAVFKLMLRYMYGGKLPPISRDTAVKLLLCADKYNIQPLVQQSEMLLIPTSVEELFPALVCVTYVSLPTLLPHVTKLLQEKTDQVVRNKQFLQLDANCVEFIAKQDTLAITELELWFSLVSWAKAKAEDPTEQRRLLAKPLKHVRFLTLTQNQIVKEVMHLEILSPVELIALLSATTNKKALKEPGLCSLKEIRKKIIFKNVKSARSNNY